MSQSVRKGLPSRSPEVVPDPAAGDGEGQLERLERLRQEFEANAAKPPAGKSPFDALTKQASKFWSTHSRASKAVIGLLLLAVVGWLPIRSLLQATSTEAVVNARLVTLRAPIEGDIEAPAGINVGTHFKAGDTVLRVVNRRADRSRIDDLTRLIDQLRERAYEHCLAHRRYDRDAGRHHQPAADLPGRTPAPAQGPLRRDRQRAGRRPRQPRRGPEGPHTRRADRELGQHSCRDAGTLPARCPGDRRDLYRHRAPSGGAAGRAEGRRVRAPSSATPTTTSRAPPSASTRSASASTS